MDGLLGGNQLETLGLLGLSPEEINRARGQAQSDMYFALASQLLSGGPTGASIARGLQQGQQAYKQAMRGSLDEQLQSTQVQDFLRKRKLEEEALKRQQMIDTAVARAYQPATATTEYQRMTPQQLERAAEPGFEVPQITTVTPARLDFQSIAPALMASAEGRKTLADLVAAQKAISGELTKIGEGEKLFRINPITREQEVVATGAPKVKEPPASIQEYNFAVSQGYKGSLLDYQTAKAKAGAGSTVVYPPGALTPDKSTAKDAQTNLLQTGARLSLYNQIEAQFKPEYLQPTFRAGQAWSSIKERAGKNLSPQEIETLRDFSQFRQNSINNLSQTIKELTGAAMGIQEADRIMAGMPNAGTGLFDGDSPTEFKAKLDNVTKQMRYVEARNAYILRKGLSFKDIPLDRVPKLINDRAEELAKEYRVDLKNVTPTQLNAIKRQLAVEFGITAD